jgi:hypothetical protein
MSTLMDPLGTSTDRTDRSSATTDPRLPGPMVLCIAFVAFMLLAGILAELGTPPLAAVTVTSAAVAVVAWRGGPLASLGVATLAFLFLSGFDVEASGTLLWHGDADVLRLTALVVAGAGSALVHDVLVRTRQ